jgi:LytS/YehU family sensor histidine kinase
MHRNVEAADEMLAQLGDLLRLSLERKNVQEAPLREELAVLAPYLNILRIRFGDRLSICVDVDPALLDVTVPLFILQPLVENAIRHGIDRRAGAGRIDIRACAAEEFLEISVADDGAGLSQNGLREGIGLSNIRLRLEPSRSREVRSRERGWPSRFPGAGPARNAGEPGQRSDRGR